MNLRRMLAVVVGAMLGTAAPAVAAQSPSGEGSEEVPEMVTDRPDVTESASIVPRAWLQAETGVTLEREPGAATNLSGPGTLLRLGLGARFEARAAWEGVVHLFPDDAGSSPSSAGREVERTGGGDAEISLKTLLLRRAGSRPDLALLTAVTLPVGERPFTSGSLDPGLTALLANDLGPGLSWAANVGLAWTGVGDASGGDRRRAGSWSVSFGFEASETTGGFVEYFAEDAEGEPAVHALDAGLTHRLGRDVQLDASGGIGIVEAAPDWLLGLGLSFRFPL